MTYFFTNKVTGMVKSVEARSLKEAKELLKQAVALFISPFNSDYKNWKR